MKSKSQRSGSLNARAIVDRLGPGTVFDWVLATTKLRNILRLNAAFLTALGVTSVLFPGRVATQLGISTDAVPVVRGTAVSLLAYALVVVLIATGPARRVHKGALVIAVIQVGWVLTTGAFLVGGVFSQGGIIAALAIAIIVGEFALLELRGHTRAHRAAPAAVETRLDETPPTEAVLVRRAVEAPAEGLWRVMIDHGLYATLASNLGGARAITENGPGLVRECTDIRGRSWRESCLVWEPGHRFAMKVDTDATDYPYPLARMEGSWGVRQLDPRRSEVTVAFAFRPLPVIWGGLLTIVMHLGFPVIVRRIIRGWVQKSSEAAVR